MQNLTIVIDHNVPAFWQNRILDREHMSQFPGGAALTDLAEAARQSRYGVMTADVFLSQPTPSRTGLVLTEIGSRYTNTLLRRGLVPAVCSCAEPPIVVPDFYHNLARRAGRYEHVFLYGGARDRLKETKSCFHPFFWPNQDRQVQAGKPWPNRRFLVLINSNKRAFPTVSGPLSLRHPRSSLKGAYSHAKGLLVRHFDPWMHSDLYVERLRAIHYFSRNPRFDLYGHGWESPVLGAKRASLHGFDEALQRSYRGTIPARDGRKLEVLGCYKFSVCFENTAFPGYITEKIFDCFLSGCIPIYYGAPDIDAHIPSQAFIDFRRFRSYADAERYLLDMDESEAERCLESAARFLASEAFDKFYVSEFVRGMMAALEDVAARCV
jgi:hypothetical protein